MGEALEIERFFVCVGAQKAGTTWLARVLDRHPNFFGTPVKEIHYFDHLAGLTRHLSDRKRRSRYRKFRRKRLTQWGRRAELNGQRDWYRAYMADTIDDDWYRSLFRRRGACAFAGEATPEYALIGEQGFRHLRRLAPDVRLAYILRNPVERAWSQILHLCRSTGLDADRASSGELIGLGETGRFARMGDYMATINDLGAVFDAEQVLLEFYEDIHADRAAGLERICAFIGLAFEPAWFPGLERRYNVSQKADMPDPVRDRLRRRYAPLADEIEQTMGRLPDAWRLEFG